MSEVASSIDPDNIEKPRYIILALRLIWFSVFISAVGSILQIITLPSNFPLNGGGLAISAIVGFSLIFFLIFKIEAGKNWARIAYLVLYILSVVSLINTVMSGYSYSMIQALSTVAIHGMALLTLFLLFHSQSKSWFNRPANENP